MDYKGFTEKDWGRFAACEIAVCTPDEHSYFRFMEECERRGYMWRGGKFPTEKDFVSFLVGTKENRAITVYKSNTPFQELVYGVTEFYKAIGREIRIYNNPLPVVHVTLDDGARAPEFAHTQDAGLDVFSREDKTVPARGSAVFDTGVHIQIPDGYFGELKSKSGLNVNHNITSTGVIDAGYTGSMRVKLYNHGDTDYEVKTGDKISQLIIQPYYKCAIKVTDSLPDNTERGNNGFGSTGR